MRKPSITIDLGAIAGFVIMVVAMFRRDWMLLAFGAAFVVGHGA